VIACTDPAADMVSETPAAASSAVGEHDAFRALYQRHFDRVFGLMTRFGASSSEAEDLTQRVFVVAYRHGAELGGIRSPEAWLREIAVRVVHQHFRWWRVRRAARFLEQTWAGRVVDERSPEREVMAGEALARVRAVLRGMSEKLRDVLVLVDLEGLSPREAAQVLGVPVNTVRSRRALGRDQFRRLWERLEPGRRIDHD
jgi:RNA polymerase sigma factor (sigma-70 family)